jgi:small conductance mechanosensitive channel
MIALASVFRAFVCPLLIALSLLAVQPALAQAPAPADPQGISAKELEKLVGMLENDAERERFIGRLKTLIEADRRTAPAEPVVPDRIAGRFLGDLAVQLGKFGDTIFRAAAFVADAPKLLHWLRAQIENEWSRQRLTEILWKIGIVLFGAWLAEWITIRLLARTRRQLGTRPIGDGWARVPFILFHALLGLTTILVFAATAFGLLAVVAPSRTANVVVLALINANLIARAIRLLGWMVLSPRIQRLRLLPVDDETANYAFIWIRRLTNVTVYGYFTIEAALVMGLPRTGYVFLQRFLGLLVALLLVILILQNRVAVARMIAGRVTPDRTVTNLRRRLADIWHVGALLYVFLIALIWLLRTDGGFTFVMQATALTIGIVFSAWLASLLLRGLVTRLFSLSREMRTRFPTLEAHANRYMQIITVVGTTLIWAFAILAVLQAWGAGSLDWLESAAGRRLTGSLVSIGLTILVAVGLWELVNALLERYFTRPTANGLDSYRRAARARTLLPLLQQVTFGFLAVFVGLVTLSEIGINIAPLLAGAGIVGIAVGFGAQALMKDLFSGISIILEDSIAVGDVIAVGNKSGSVEWMSLRVMRLRDFDGTVHTIPFGEVQTISNRTKDFAFAVFRIGVAYGSDVEKVQRVMRETMDEMRKNPELGATLLGELELYGVDSFGDSAMVVLARIKVMPGKQWTVMRAYNTLLKVAFEREGIEIPFPQRVIRVVHTGKPDGTKVDDAIDEAAVS